MKRTCSLILTSLILCALAACGDVREDLGLGRSSPDEFAVVDRAPLSMPPDFSLRPPEPGSPRPQEPDPTKSANNVLFGTTTGSVTPAASPAAPAVDKSGSVKALLANTGAANANPDIRHIVDKEASEKVVGSPRLVDELLWWKKREPPVATVDAAAEAARIKDAKAKGQPLNQGATPIIEQDKSGWLGL